MGFLDFVYSCCKLFVQSGLYGSFFFIFMAFVALMGVVAICKYFISLER